MSHNTLEQQRVYSRRYRERHPERVRAAMKRRDVRRKFGLSVEEYDARLAEPCAICGGPSEVLDHNHRTGQPRMGLCHHCNRALGGFRDDPELLRRAATYLEEHSCSSV